MTVEQWLADLEAKAKAATPGPWENHVVIRRGYGVTAILSGDGTIADTENSEFPTEDADAAHIAANDPQTIMADIDDVLRLRAEVERLEKEADWLANRLNNTSINQCCFCPDGIKQYTVKCECTKTWRDIARKAVEKQTCPKN